MNDMTLAPASAALTLAEIPTIETQGAAEVLAEITAKVNAFEDARSNSPRLEERRSLAAQIAKAKVAMVKLGKDLTVGWRTQTTVVNAECNLIETRMDAWRDAIRQPLTDWENTEKARVAAHQAALAQVTGWAAISVPMTADQLAAHIHALETDPLTTRDWEEYTGPAKAIIAESLGTLLALMTATEQAESEAAELALLRAADDERKAKEAAQQQVAREQQLVADAIAGAERDRLAAVNAATQAINDAKAALAQAERDRIAAGHAAQRRQDEALAKADADRLAQIAADRADQARRTADRDNRARVLTAAKEALVEHAELTEDQARATVRAIVAGLVPVVSVQF